MTTTTRIEPNGYDPATVPATDDDRSRYELGVLPAGWESESRAATVAHVFEALAGERITAAAPLTPEAVTVRLFFVGRRQSDGEWALLTRGQATGYATKQPTRPGRFTRIKLEGGALLDAVFLGEDSNARDDVLWAALLEFCRRTNPSPKATRRLNDALARVIALRAGLEVRPDELPAVGAPHS